jgi:hypothetical protein
MNSSREMRFPGQVNRDAGHFFNLADGYMLNLLRRHMTHTLPMTSTRMMHRRAIRADVRGWPLSEHV